MCKDKEMKEVSNMKVLIVKLLFFKHLIQQFEGKDHCFSIDSILGNFDYENQAVLGSFKIYSNWVGSDELKLI